MLEAFKTSQERVKQKTVVAQVMEEIKQFIIKESLQPGDKLPSESDLAAMFNISRSSIREALKIFQFLGIVETSGPKGKIICKETKIATETLNWSLLLASPEYKDLIELRLSMEEQGLWYMEVFRKDDEKLRNKIITELKEAIENMRSVQASKSLEHRLNADFNFHGHIVSICKNPIFDTVYENIRILMLNHLLRYGNIDESLFANPESHAALVTKIENGDFTETSQAFKNHVIEVQACIIKQ